MKKRVFAAITALALLLCMGIAMADGQRVYDDAGLFSADEAAALEQRIAELRQQHGYDFAVHTADSGVYDTADYADTFYEDMGFGTGEEYSGVLFFIDMQSRTTFISTSGHLINIIDDAREEEIFDAQMDYLSAGDFGGAMLASLDMASQYIADGPVEGYYGYDETTGELLNPSDYGGYEEPGFSLARMLGGLAGGLALGLLAGVIARAAISRSYARRYKPVAYDIERNARLNLTASDSNVVNKFVTTRRIPRNNNSGGGGSFGRGGGGGSGVRISSGGRSHGGGGRRF